jgi:MFS transporter
LNLIQVQGYSATAAGAALLPFILIMFFLSRWSGGLIKRYGPRLPLVIGPMIAAIGFVLFAVPKVSSNYWSSFFPAIVLLGFGMAVSVAPLTTTVMNSVSRNQSGIASGVNNAVSRTAGLLAVAIFGIVMLLAFNHRLDERLKNIEITNPLRMSLDEGRVKLAGIELPSNLDAETRMKLQDAITDSFVFGFRGIMWMAAGLAVASSLSAWLIIEVKTDRQRREV